MQLRERAFLLLIWGWHLCLWFMAFGATEYGVMKPETLLAYEDGFWMSILLLAMNTILMLAFVLLNRRGKPKTLRLAFVLFPIIHVFFLRVYYIAEYGVNLCGRQDFFPIRQEYFSICF